MWVAGGDFPSMSLKFVTICHYLRSLTFFSKAPKGFYISKCYGDMVILTYWEASGEVSELCYKSLLYSSSKWYSCSALWLGKINTWQEQIPLGKYLPSVSHLKDTLVRNCQLGLQWSSNNSKTCLEGPSSLKFFFLFFLYFFALG